MYPRWDYKITKPKKGVKKMQKQFLTPQEVADRYGISKTTVWKWVRDGKLAAPVKLAEQTTRFKLADLLEWEQTLAPGEAEQSEVS